MRILLVNKFIFPKGGAETYTFDVGKMLEEHGHEVQYFGLENEKNTVGNRVGSYVTNMDFSQGIFYLLGSVLFATAVLSFLMKQSQGMEALQMLIGGFVIFMIPQVVGSVAVFLELVAATIRQVWYI